MRTRLFQSGARHLLIDGPPITQRAGGRTTTGYRRLGRTAQRGPLGVSTAILLGLPFDSRPEGRPPHQVHPTMIETNPILAQIADLKDRIESLRGYL